ncbi:3-oxoadipate enol-lactonase [Kribbella speibonae]|uniref:3-oxoadipate enol-lactonase n=1 Tax=Kribbella speibonae TaxID=1572660 RepID=A0ABY2AEU7_9ACTN|nr:3-oxoadipate enol-lactonase [Kribbella speibonae]TCC27362.1 3-oxoadipate enol-lactonase [Kribbella speibonae]
MKVASTISGRSDAPTVVLANSLGSMWEMWDANLASLERHFRVVRFDTRGHGRSPVPPGPYTIDDLTDDVVELLDFLELERAHFVGLSLGGMAGLRLAAREPERVDRLVVLCTGARLDPSSAWIDRAALVRARGTAAVAEAVVQRWYTGPWLDRHPRIRKESEEMVASTPPDGYAACCEVIAAMDLLDDLPSITAPTLAIAGADDPATPPWQLERIATAVADGKLLVVPEAAHLASAERPDLVTPAVIAHLQGDGS